MAVSSSDSPFVRREFCGMLCEKAVGFDAAVPLKNERHEPLHAVYSTRAFHEFERCLGEGKRRPIEAYATLNLAFVSEEECRAVDSTLASLVNINTPEELAEWDRRLRGARLDQLFTRFSLDSP